MNTKGDKSEADRAREERRLRRGGTQEEYTTRGKEVRRKTNVVRDIRERDKDIRREQMMEFRRQREDLVAARRLDRKGNASMEETGNMEDRNVQELLDRRKQVEEEIERLENAVGGGSTELDYIDDIELDEGRKGMTRNTTTVTVDVHRDTHSDRTSPIQRRTASRMTRDEIKTVECPRDPLQDRLDWIDEQYNSIENDNSEDRITQEGEDVKGKIKKEQDSYVLKRTREMDEDEVELRKQIECMKLEETELEEDIRWKEHIRRQRMNEEELKLKEKRMRNLLRQKDELSKSLLEKATTLTSLDGDQDGREMYVNKPRRRLTHVRSPERPKEHRSFMFKPSVPKLTDPDSFQEWKIEIQGMIESNIYHDDILRHAVRNSITGLPRKVLATLKASASMTEIIETLESNFGNIRSGEALMEEFYTMKQGKKETLSTWAIRLESLLQLAIEKGVVAEAQKDGMLRKRFWRHLENTELRNSTRVYFETSYTFEDLKREIRREELELKGTHHELDRIPQINTQQVDQQTKLLKQLTEQVREMEFKLEEIRKEKHHERRQQQFRPRPNSYQRRQDRNLGGTQRNQTNDRQCRQQQGHLNEKRL